MLEEPCAEDAASEDEVRIQVKVSSEGEPEHSTVASELGTLCLGQGYPGGAPIRSLLGKKDVWYPVRVVGVAAITDEELKELKGKCIQGGLSIVGARRERNSSEAENPGPDVPQRKRKAAGLNVAPQGQAGPARSTAPDTHAHRLAPPLPSGPALSTAPGIGPATLQSGITFGPNTAAADVMAAGAEAVEAFLTQYPEQTERVQAEFTSVGLLGTSTVPGVQAEFTSVQADVMNNKQAEFTSVGLSGDHLPAGTVGAKTSAAQIMASGDPEGLAIFLAKYPDEGARIQRELCDVSILGAAQAPSTGIS